jgi:hypothetical protein
MFASSESPGHSEARVGARGCTLHGGMPWAEDSPSTSAPRGGDGGGEEMPRPSGGGAPASGGASSALRAALAARRARRGDAEPSAGPSEPSEPTAQVYTSILGPRPSRSSAPGSGSANDENAPPSSMSPNASPSSSLRERAALAARAKAELDGDRAEATARASLAARDAEFAEAEASVHDQIVTQRALRKPQGRGGLAEREISVDASLSSGAGKKNWGVAKTALAMRRAAVHLSNVHHDRWVDVDALFAYYDGTYFDGKLGESDTTFSWAEREEMDDDDFRYCLCSEVPGWWHGSHKGLMCGVSCNIEHRRGGVARRTAHIRMPEAMRKFKLTKPAKETLLHAMTHCYLFLVGATKEHEPFYEHGSRFRAFTRRLNNDTLTFDAFRPEGGYAIAFNDAGDAADVDELLKQETLDSLSVEHFKVLYLVSKYSAFAERARDAEVWVRYQPLLVLMYECIVRGVFDYDYAPASAMVHGKRIYMNVTQEGRDHLEDLVEAKYVRALRTITEDKQPVVAYQITETGLDVLVKSTKLRKADRRAVDEVIRDPEGSLLSVRYDPTTQTFRLSSENGFCYDSDVTETEDVSYVSSPYLPFTCRDLRRPMASNAHRAAECGTGASSVRDELDVQITVSRLVILVGEWVPFGCNQIMALTRKLGADERVKGGYFSSHVDSRSTETTLEIPVGLTKVAVNSCDAAQWINIEAEVEFPEDEGITQIENFGIRYQRDGTTLYGLKLEAVMDKILNDISLDYLSRVMTDIHMDSSRVTESLTSERQATLLKMVFNGNEMNRNKVNVFIAEKITPKLRALRYLDGDALEAELKQVIGDTQHAFDITENDVVIFGSAGVLFAGPECIQHETLLLAFLALKAREDFVANFFNRLFLVAEHTDEQRRLIAKYHEDPDHVNSIRNSLAKINEDCIMLEEIMRNLEASVEKDAIPPERMPNTKAGKRLFHILQIPKMEASLRGRVRDCEKRVSATRHEIAFLSEQIANITRALREQVNRDTKHLFKASSEQMKLNDTASARDVMQLIFAGSLSFGIVDRCTGEWSVVWDAWFRDSLQYTLVLSSGGGFFWVAITLWLCVGAFVLAYMRLKRDRITGMVHFLARLDVQVDVPKLYAYLRARGVMSEEVVALNHADAAHMRVFTYVDDGRRESVRVGEPPVLDLWDGYRPEVSLTLDARNGVLREAEVTATKPKLEPARVFPRELRERLVGDLRNHDVLIEEDFVASGGFGDRKAKARSNGIEGIFGNDKRDTAAKRRRRARELETGNALVLVARRPGDASRREVALDTRDLATLKERLAHKYCHKVEHVVSVATFSVVDGVEIEEDVEDDQQVRAMREYQHVEVRFRGKPDPGMSTFAARLRAVNRARAAGVKANLFDEGEKNVPRGVASREGDPDPDAFDPETFDVEDLLYGVGKHGAR